MRHVCKICSPFVRGTDIVLSAASLEQLALNNPQNAVGLVRVSGP